MKWIIHGAGLLISAILLTALRTFGLYPSTSPVGAGVATVLIFFLGVYFFPRLIIKSVENKRASAPPDTPAVHQDEPSVEPAPLPECSTVEAPVPKRKYKPIRRDVAGYQLAVFCLSVVAVLSVLNYFSMRSDADALQAQLEEQYHDRYEEGYSDAESVSYDNGYDAGRQDGVAEGYNILYDEASFFRENACFVTPGGNCYHHYGCPHISGSEYWIYNIELAESKGYTPCLDCWKSELHILKLPSE